MKYRLAAVLVLALIFAFSVTAHAAQIPTEPDFSIMSVKKVR